MEKKKIPLNANGERKKGKRKILFRVKKKRREEKERNSEKNVSIGKKTKQAGCGEKGEVKDDRQCPSPDLAKKKRVPPVGGKRFRIGTEGRVVQKKESASRKKGGFTFAGKKRELKYP